MKTVFFQSVVFLKIEVKKIQQLSMGVEKQEIPETVQNMIANSSRLVSGKIKIAKTEWQKFLMLIIKLLFYILMSR